MRNAIWILRTVCVMLLFSAVPMGCTLIFPSSASAQSSWYVKEKRCSSCGRQVSISSRVGQKCPHCGAYWSYETKEYSNRSARTTRTHRKTSSSTPRPQAETRKLVIHYNGKTSECDSRSQDDNVLIPLREFAGNLGLTVDFTPPDAISVSKGERRVQMQLDKRAMTTYGSSQEGALPVENTLPVPCTTYADVAYVPMRALAEAMGLSLEYKYGSGEVFVSDSTASPVATKPIAGEPFPAKQIAAEPGINQTAARAPSAAPTNEPKKTVPPTPAPAAGALVAVGGTAGGSAATGQIILFGVVLGLLAGSVVASTVVLAARLRSPSTGFRAIPVLRGPDGRSIPLGVETVTIGRDDDCTLTLSAANASRRHAAISPEGDFYVIQDLGSTHGTYVNNEKCTRRVLKHGDSIRLGSAELLFLSKWRSG